MDPQELKATLSSGLLSFPVTDFDAAGDFRPESYARRLEWLTPYGASALFAVGGTGEFFSITPGEYPEIVRTAVETCRGRVPILAGAGGPTRTAVALAQEAERLGAAGLLLFPHYLTEASQDGLAAHAEAVCRAVRIGVVVYNRATSRLTADTLERLCERCPNLVGFKDGLGEIELMVTIRRRLGERLAYLGGLPTAEVYAAAYKALGVPVYSSAVFNFIPQDCARVLPGPGARRPRHDGPPARHVLPALHRDPEPASRLRGEHREGGRAPRRPRRGPGAAAAHRSAAGGARGARRPHPQARPAVAHAALRSSRLR